MPPNLLHWLYPSRCLFCRRILSGGEEICKECAGKVLWIEEPSCPRCARGMDRCACKKAEASFSGLAAAVYYGEVVKRGMALFKFYKRKSVKRILGDMMAKRITCKFPEVRFDFVTCVPQSPARLKERGFNQAELLADQVAGRLGIKMRREVLKKIKETPQQSRLGRRARMANLKGAFGVSRPEEVQGKIILLVDDVTTTGATLAECSRALFLAGAKEVYCCVFALSLPVSQKDGREERELLPSMV